MVGYMVVYRDFGRVITVSGNFSESGLIANREFNVELKNRADVEFALAQFEELRKTPSLSPTSTWTPSTVRLG